MKNRFVFCVVLLCIASAVAYGQQVSVNYNHDANFAQFHTNAWGSNNTNEIQNSILAQVAHLDINAAMQEKGLQMVQESQSPDLILTSNGGMRRQTSYSAWGMRGNRWRLGGNKPRTERGRNLNYRSLQRQDAVAGVAGNCAERAEQ